MNIDELPKARIDLPVVSVRLAYLSSQALDLLIDEHARVLSILRERAKDQRLTRATRERARGKLRKALRTVSRLRRERSKRPPAPQIGPEWPET